MKKSTNKQTKTILTKVPIQQRYQFSLKDKYCWFYQLICFGYDKFEETVVNHCERKKWVEKCYFYSREYNPENSPQFLFAHVSQFAMLCCTTSSSTISCENIVLLMFNGIEHNLIEFSIAIKNPFNLISRKCSTQV